MIKTVVASLVNLLLTGDIGGSVVGILGEVVGSSVERGMKRKELYAQLDQFIEIQRKGEVSGRLKCIIEELKKELLLQIKEHNIDVMNFLRQNLKNEFEVLDIPIEKRERLEENLAQYVMHYINKTDITFYNDILIKRVVDNYEERICKLEKNDAEKQKQLILVGNGTAKLHINDYEKIDKRDEEIKEIEEMFLEQKNVVFLYGRPGMGKTTLARLYANWFSERRKEECSIYFVHYQESFETTLKMLVIKSGNYSGKDVLNYFKMLDLYERKKILLVIDNFNENTLQGREKRSFEEEIQGEFFAELRDLGIRILITTRIKISENVYNVKSVSNTFELFNRYADVEIMETDKELVIDIIKALKSNTMLIVLAAHLWRKNKNEGKLLLDRIRDGKTERHADELPYIYETKVDGGKSTIYGQAESLLDLSGILADEKHKKIFVNVALLPLTGIAKADFIQFTGSSNENALNHLIDNSWVIEEGENVMLHPLVREILINKRIITYKECRKYCESIGNEIAMNKKFSHRLSYKACAEEIFTLFSTKKSPSINLIELFYNLSDVYDMLGNRKKSYILAEKVYEHIDVYDKKPLKKAERLSGIAYSLNNYYRNRRGLKRAERLLKEAEEVYAKIDVKTVDDKVQYYQTKGKILSNYGSNCIAKGKLNEAEMKQYYSCSLEWHEKALAHREESLNTDIAKLVGEDINSERSNAISRRLKADVATSLGNIGTTHFYMGDYASAIEFHNKARKMREDLGLIKLSFDNLQRVVGSLIEYYRKELDVNIEWFANVLNSYPELIKTNISYELYASLETNINYFILLAKIISNDTRCECLRDKLEVTREEIVKCLQEDSLLWQKYNGKIKIQ